MIVRDGEKDLPECLDSVRGIVDEIVIGDTGSNDQTAAVARGYGARVIEVPWTDHFAEARNRVLDVMESDWVLVLDVDERLDAVTSGRLRAHLEAECDGYQVLIRNYVEQLNARLWDQPAIPNDGLLPESARFAGWLGHRNVRLFRNHPAIRFSGRVHETVGESLLGHGMRLGVADLVIHHLGFPTTPEAQRRKHEFYLDLGRRKLVDTPDNAQAHFEMGLEELTRGAGARESLGYFVQSCRLDPHFALAWVFGAVALSLLGQFGAAEEFLAQAESLGYDSSLMVELRADFCFQKGEYEAARAGYQRLLDRSGTAPEAESKLGMALWKLGEWEAGRKRLESAVGRFADVEANHDRLIAMLVAADGLEEAAQAARVKLTSTRPQAENYLRLASLQAQLGRMEDVRETLMKGLERFPGEESLVRAVRESGFAVPEMKSDARKGRKK